MGGGAGRDGEGGVDGEGGGSGDSEGGRKGRGGEPGGDASIEYTRSSATVRYRPVDGIGPASRSVTYAPAVVPPQLTMNGPALGATPMGRGVHGVDRSPYEPPT